jgi:hypothetical protein
VYDCSVWYLNGVQATSASLILQPEIASRDMPVDMPELFQILQEFADLNYPDHGVVELVIYQNHGRPSRLALPPRLPSLRARVHAEPDDVPDQEREREDDILRAVAENPDKKLTGERLAPLAGHEFTTPFRRTLARLVREEKLKNEGSGYVLTEP